MTASARAPVPYESPAPVQTPMLGDGDEDEAITRRDDALQALYGSDFPLLEPEQARQQESWCRWAESLWRSREAQMVYPLWIAQRNRKFWQGEQYLDSTGIGRRWVVPRAPSDAVRQVVNLTKAALNLRSQIVSEQRPGYKVEPTNRDTVSRKKAEAKQLALNYAWKACNLEYIHAELARWAGTDGVAFCETYWDDDAGPFHELTQVSAGQVIRLGDLRKRVLRIDEVRVSPNATATVTPHWMVVRRVVDTGDAVKRWGPQVAGQSSDPGEVSSWGKQGLLSYTDTGRQDDRFSDTPTLEEWTVYCARSDFLPQGLELHAVGQRATYAGPLLFGCLPVGRFTDGSKDPAYFPEPEMNNWVDDQVAINQIVSKMIEVVRKTAGGAFLARPHTITSESRMFGGVSLIEVQGTGALDDIVKYLDPKTVGPDAMALLTFHLQQFEQKSGWNDATRGSFQAKDASGRAILAIREQVERIFAPLTSAFARGAVEDSHVSLAAMKWGYDVPRQMAVTGRSRMDLARYISAEDLDGIADIEIDPQTLMPKPFSLRMFTLDNDFARGLLTPDKYLRLRNFAWTEDIQPGDEDDRARAFRIAEMIREGMPGMQLPPVLPMDDALVHMDVLKREILLDDDLPDPVRAAAFDRYMQYEMMYSQQQMAMMATAAPPSGGGSPGGKGLPADPSQAPLMGARPSVAAGPIGMGPEELSAGTNADARSPL